MAVFRGYIRDGAGRPSNERRGERMRRIYHLVPRAVWEQNPAADYRTDSLAAEGFIHCSNADQVDGSADRFYGGESHS